MQETSQTRPCVLGRMRDPRDGQAWTVFAQIYEPLVLARRRGLRDAGARDLTQQVLIAVARASSGGIRIGTVNLSNTFSGWCWYTNSRRLHRHNIVAHSLAIRH
jgi:hypothetical protein